LAHGEVKGKAGAARNTPFDLSIAKAHFAGVTVRR
jgi:hypothetical protein